MPEQRVADFPCCDIRKRTVSELSAKEYETLLTSCRCNLGLENLVDLIRYMARIISWPLAKQLDKIDAEMTNNFLATFQVLGHSSVLIEGEEEMSFSLFSSAYYWDDPALR